MNPKDRLRRLLYPRQSGWSMSEYLAVLVGLLVVWWSAEGVLAMIQEHHDEFTWALMMPY
ncbi:MAG TPA: hypothetical protein VIL28_07725 [Steroidobacteraceae bacterium]